MCLRALELLEMPFEADNDCPEFTQADSVETSRQILADSLAAYVLHLSESESRPLLLATELDAFTASIAKPQQTAPATDTSTPAPVVADGDAPAKHSNRKPSWATVAMPYMKSLFTAGHYKSASMFYRALMHRAGEAHSPFKLVNHELYCTEAGTTVSKGSLGNVWPQIRAH